MGTTKICDVSRFHGYIDYPLWLITCSYVQSLPQPLLLNLTILFIGEPPESATLKVILQSNRSLSCYGPPINPSNDEKMKRSNEMYLVWNTN